MFEPKFIYTTDIINDLLKIERYRTALEYLYLPTRIKQELLYKAKMKKTHFSTSIEGNILSYNQVEQVINQKGNNTKINADGRHTDLYFVSKAYLCAATKSLKTFLNI